MKKKSNSRGCFLALLVAAVFVMNASVADAGRPRKLTKPVTTKAEAESVASGGTIAMSCSKCQTTIVEDVDGEKSFLDWFMPDTKHACPGCEGEMVYSGPPGKKSAKKFVHTCSKCGDASAYCCSTTEGKPTKGMEKKKTE